MEEVPNNPEEQNSANFINNEEPDELATVQIKEEA